MKPGRIILMLAGGAVLLLWYLGRRKQAADAALVAAEKAAGPGPLLLPLTATQNKSAKGGTGSTSTSTTAPNAPVLTAAELNMLVNPKTGLYDETAVRNYIGQITPPKISYTGTVTRTPSNITWQPQ